MCTFGIQALAVNSIITERVRNNPSCEGNIWDLVKEAEVVLISSEMLEGDDCRRCMDDPSFRARLSLLVVDEAHLVYVWSKLFRKAYGRIGYTRARLDHRVRLLLLSATLRAGAPYDAVMKSFSLSPGSFFDLHRSNLRREIRVTTSIITSSLTTSLSFPELCWVVGLDGITIIFVRD